jgi:hypothetical protein
MLLQLFLVLSLAISAAEAQGGGVQALAASISPAELG